MKYKNVTIRQDFIETISESFNVYFSKDENKKRLQMLEYQISNYITKGRESR